MIDLILLVLIGGSTLFGLLRGMVGTLVSVLGWLLAGWASFRYGQQAAFWLSNDGMPSASELFAGYAATFIVVLVAMGLLGLLLRSAIKSVGLSGLDRLLGMALGLLRGLLLGCLLILVLGFTPMTKEPAWQQSQLLPMLLPGAEWLHAKLPDWSVPELDPLNPSPAGDNGEVGGLPAPSLEGALLEGVVSQAVDAARERIGQERAAADQAAQEPAGAGTTGKDPVNLEATGTDPDSTEPAAPRPSGQSRPESK